MSIENLEYIGLPEQVAELTAETSVPPQTTGAENAMQADGGYGDWVIPMAIIGLSAAALAAFRSYKHPWSRFLEDR